MKIDKRRFVVAALLVAGLGMAGGTGTVAEAIQAALQSDANLGGANLGGAGAAA